jgi:osmotically-inducible protein OsmY
MKLFKHAMALGTTLLALCGTASAAAQDINQRVTAALESARYLYAEHIRVTSKDGVVTLHGMVGDAWDLQQAIRISSQVPGVTGVVDDLEIWQFGGRGR